ncbi:MAE_28990/MAE_18760 family HEPN-like nuclease [uncultured Brevundimonas sp.]|uniref:MAE_28990/MAE_18760 family HEPN-like nuclease n=1 Tax=uncultured Brevundimonas sp. TaxID=213418 RepID=UPI0025CCFDC0|nr:MAE_28990/MAE_18760 family HEPN-like nuclease [uncultured Brevundimonas sp.]
MASLLFAEKQLAAGSIPSKHEAELRMFKAGAMLVLYNVVEASARGGIEAIYDEMAVNQVTFDDLRPALKRRIVQDFKANFSASNSDRISLLAHQMISESFNAEKLFTGNVDAKLIRDKAAIFGFNADTDYDKTHHGSDLVVVKRKRNDLAHGVVSFSEVGRDYTARDLYRLGQRVTRYIEAILLQVDAYLDNGDYLG